MKGNYFLGDRQFQVREMSFPPLGDFEVKIQNMAAEICGTDIHIYHGEKSSAEVTPPVVLGHEIRRHGGGNRPQRNHGAGRGSRDGRS